MCIRMSLYASRCIGTSLIVRFNFKIQIQILLLLLLLLLSTQNLNQVPSSVLAPVSIASSDEFKFNRSSSAFIPRSLHTHSYKDYIHVASNYNSICIHETHTFSLQHQRHSQNPKMFPPWDCLMRTVLVCPMSQL